jgi:hypothetical protein
MIQTSFLLVIKGKKRIQKKNFLCNPCILILIDQVRPDWFETIALQKGINGSAGNGTTRRTVVRLNRNSSSESEEEEEEESGNQPNQWELEETLVLETIRHLHQSASNDDQTIQSTT